MNLFSKDKDLIHRIANFVLIIWIVVGVLIAYTGLINLVVKKYQLTYDEYKIQYCNLSVNPTDTDKDEDNYCQDNYERYKIGNKDEDYINKLNLINGLGNVVIVGAALYLLNRKRD
jgi:hypothetical protein